MLYYMLARILAIGLSLYVCVSVCHTPFCVKMVERIQLVFVTEPSLGRSYAELKGNACI